MSILIKVMKMPESCYDCPIECEGDVCGITKGGCTWDVKPPHCPLIEVPPHGRLIDADELITKQQEDADLFINPYTLMEKSRRDEALNAVANIVNAPTIIEAEEDET